VLVVAVVLAAVPGFGGGSSSRAGLRHAREAVPEPVAGDRDAEAADRQVGLKQGEILSARYGRTHLPSLAKGASEAELEALAKSTLGVPQANLRAQKAT
jgi:hypothetical protein